MKCAGNALDVPDCVILRSCELIAYLFCYEDTRSSCAMRPASSVPENVDWLSRDKWGFPK